MKTLLMMLALAASHTADAYRTNNVMNHQHGVEHNAIARPFVHGERWCAVSSAAGFVITVGVDHHLRKHHRKRVADFVTGASIVGHTVGAVTTH